MIPHVYWSAYLTANAFALIVLATAFWRPRLARWVGVGVFAWAATINTWTAWSTPRAYMGYADFAVPVYRDFIVGWFSTRIEVMVASIAAGQLIIASMLAAPDRRLRLAGLFGALTFLTAIAPLGVGAGFPFSLTFGGALAVAEIPRPDMPGAVARAIQWIPRVMACALVLMLIALAADGWVGATLLDRVVALGLHLVPAAIAATTLAVAWRAPRLGGMMCFALAFGYALLTGGRVSWLLAIAGPLIVEGTLFLMSSSGPRRNQNEMMLSR